MKIILATGIYPPAIGGPATYVEKLAWQLHQRGIDVTVLTFGTVGETIPSDWPVERVSKAGGPVVRWNRYAKVLRKLAKNADIVYAFSAVSVGIPLVLARLKKPKKILRLGGDFLWERYTDLGGRRSLRAFYRTVGSPAKAAISWLFPKFDHIVFSTEFQEQIYQQAYRRKLPAHSVIQNALPEGEVELHERHETLRLLYMGRFVRFKNLPALLQAVSMIPHVRLTLVGEGPMEEKLRMIVQNKGLSGRVTFLPSVHGNEKLQVLREHDVMVLPSITDISPNAAIEARAVGLPVLLTEETGLSTDLSQGMTLRQLQRGSDITRAILEAEHQYEQLARDAASPFQHKRTWEQLAEEHVELFRRIL
jgi:glycosyltransferase involved in cell wall biosynthesis